MEKKSAERCFDVTMGRFDGAELLYQDDGLILLRNLSNQQMDKKTKSIIKIFKDIGFNTDIQKNLKEVDFLDVTLNLQNDTYRS